MTLVIPGYKHRVVDRPNGSRLCLPCGIENSSIRCGGSAHKRIMHKREDALKKARRSASRRGAAAVFVWGDGRSGRERSIFSWISQYSDLSRPACQPSKGLPRNRPSAHGPIGFHLALRGCFLQDHPQQFASVGAQGAVELGRAHARVHGLFPLDDAMVGTCFHASHRNNRCAVWCAIPTEIGVHLGESDTKRALA